MERFCVGEVQVESLPSFVKGLLVPSIGEAFLLWPDAEGEVVASLSGAYQELDPSQAAEWATDFLATHNRDDLVLASAVANLASVDQSGALELMITLPYEARVKAVGAFTDTMDISDFDHVMDLANTWDRESKSFFTERIFDRLGFERLEETAQWLANNPEADPTAAASIARHMVIEQRAAIQWADNLQNEDALSAAILVTYQRWGVNDLDGAVEDVLTHYPDDLQHVAEIFKGASADRAGSAVYFWDQALAIENEPARAQAISGLLEPMLLSHGLETTRQHINALPEDSLEYEVAEQALIEVMKSPVVAQRLSDMQQGAKEDALDARPSSN